METDMTVNQMSEALQTAREMVIHYQNQVGDWVNKLETEMLKAKIAMEGN